MMTMAVALVVLLPSCGKGSGGAKLHRNEIKEASLLQMQREAGYTLVTVSDPWSASRGKVLHRYALVPRDSVVPDSLPDGATVVRVPIDTALVYSSVHTAVLAELGALDAVKGVADAQYFNDAEIKRRLAAGTIADCGQSLSPDIEKVIALTPDAVLLSPYQDATYGQITKLGVPIIECADYMETTPLGRAEWIKFYGELVGQRERADSIYNAVAKHYNELKEEIAAEGGNRPMVLTESVINGVWNVPGGGSYMALLIEDAGGNYPWRDDDHTGSLSLDFNQVLERAQNADVWLIKSRTIHSLADLRAAYSLNDRFAAFERRMVYVCDVERSDFFDTFPFHPDVLLQEYAQIFHPQRYHDGVLRFFKPLE